MHNNTNLIMVWPLNGSTTPVAPEEESAIVPPSTPGLTKWITGACKSMLYGTPVPQKSKSRASSEFSALTEKYRQLSAQYHDEQRGTGAHQPQPFDAMEVDNDKYTTPTRGRVGGATTTGHRVPQNGILKTPGANVTSGNTGIAGSLGRESAGAGADSLFNRGGTRPLGNTTKNVQFARGFTPDSVSSSGPTPPDAFTSARPIANLYSGSGVASNTIANTIANSTSNSNTSAGYSSSFTPAQDPPVRTRRLEFDANTSDNMGEQLVDAVSALSTQLAELVPNAAVQQKVVELEQKTAQALEYALHKDQEAADAQLRCYKMMEEFTEIGRNYENEIRKWMEGSTKIAIDNASSSQYQAWELEVNRLESELSQARLNENKLKTENLRLNDRIANLERQITISERNHGFSKKQQFQTGDTRIRELEQKLSQSAANEQQLQTKLAETQREVQDLNEHVQLLSLEMRKKTGQVDHLKSSINDSMEKDRQNAQLQAQLSAAESEKSLLREQLRRAELERDLAQSRDPGNIPRSNATGPRANNVLKYELANDDHPGDTTKSYHLIRPPLAGKENHSNPYNLQYDSGIDSRIGDAPSGYGTDTSMYKSDTDRRLASQRRVAARSANRRAGQRTSFTY